MDKNLGIPVVGGRGHVIAAAQAGVDGYLLKPFTANTLKGKIEHACERASKAA